MGWPARWARPRMTTFALARACSDRCRPNRAERPDSQGRHGTPKSPPPCRQTKAARSAAARIRRASARPPARSWPVVLRPDRAQRLRCQPDPGQLLGSAAQGRAPSSHDDLGRTGTALTGATLGQRTSSRRSTPKVEMAPRGQAGVARDRQPAASTGRVLRTTPAFRRNQVPFSRRSRPRPPWVASSALLIQCRCLTAER